MPLRLMHSLREAGAACVADEARMDSSLLSPQ